MEIKINKKRKEENMNKKALILALSLAMLTGCGQQEESQEEPTPSVESTQTSETNEEKGADMIGGEKTGEGNVTLSTPGGEGEQVTLIVDDETIMTSIDLNLENVDVDGNEPTYAYVDGKENRKMQLSKDSVSQQFLDLEEEQLIPGIHNVEVIQEKDGDQVFYRHLTYEVK